MPRALFSWKKADPGFSKHVISEESTICVLFRVCTLSTLPHSGAVVRVQTLKSTQIVDSSDMTCLENPGSAFFQENSARGMLHRVLTRKHEGSTNPVKDIP
jgi:hypothetical protein